MLAPFSGDLALRIYIAPKIHNIAVACVYETHSYGISYDSHLVSFKRFKSFQRLFSKIQEVLAPKFFQISLSKIRNWMKNYVDKLPFTLAALSGLRFTITNFR